MTIPRLSDRLLGDEIAAQQIAEEVWMALSPKARRMEALIPTIRRAGPMTRWLLAGQAAEPEPSDEVWALVVRKIERQQRRLLEPAKASP